MKIIKVNLTMITLYIIAKTNFVPFDFSLVPASIMASIHLQACVKRRHRP